MKSYSDSQKRADKKWIENNKDHASYLRSRSSARSFIRNKATIDDLNELEELIADRKQNIEEQK